MFLYQDKTFTVKMWHMALCMCHRDPLDQSMDLMVFWFKRLVCIENRLNETETKLLKTQKCYWKPNKKAKIPGDNQANIKLY